MPSQFMIYKRKFIMILWSIEMRILVAYLEEELLWAVDDVIGGLYSIDQKNFEVRCAIDCQKLFPYGKYEILSIFKWKEDYIVIVPLEISKNWIFYNKVTGEIEYRRIIERKCQEILISADRDRNQLYFFPLHIYDPILTIDLNTLKCLRMIDNWRVKVPNNCLETSWKGVYNGKYIFFSIKNTKILIRMDCENGNVKQLKLDIPEKLINIDCAFGELWVLPIRGHKLYQIDENGLILHIAELSVEDASYTLPDFARIVVQRRYLFLLPCYRKGIYVYDKIEKSTHIILAEESIFSKKDKEIYLQYWEYCVRDNQICFLPFGNEYIEIDLDNLAYKKKVISYPSIWTNKEKICRIVWSHISERDSVIREIDGCELKIFLKYIFYGNNRKSFTKCMNIGKKIWDMFQFEVI